LPRRPRPRHSSRKGIGNQSTAASLHRNSPTLRSA
jgi:hypothetical protein